MIYDSGLAKMATLILAIFTLQRNSSEKCHRRFAFFSVQQALNYQDVDTHVILLVTSRQVFHQKCQYSIIGLSIQPV